MNKKEITEKIKRFLENRKEIIFAYIFGSFVENESFNDIDLAIYIDKAYDLSKNLFYEVELSNQLEKLIKKSTDIIVLNHSNDIILNRATKGLLVKNSNDNLRVNFITTGWKKYWDFKGKLQEHSKEMKIWQ